MVCDNFCPHRHPRARTWCTVNQIELVFLATYSSWLNWIPVNRPSGERLARVG